MRLQLELTLLEWMALEAFVSEWEFNEFVRLQDQDAAEAARILALWRERGWVAESEGDLESPPMLSLTDQAYRDQPWLPNAT